MKIQYLILVLLANEHLTAHDLLAQLFPAQLHLANLVKEYFTIYDKILDQQVLWIRFLDFPVARSLKQLIHNTTLKTEGNQQQQQQGEHACPSPLICTYVDPSKLTMRNNEAKAASVPQSLPPAQQPPFGHYRSDTHRAGRREAFPVAKTSKRYFPK